MPNFVDMLDLLTDPITRIESLPCPECGYHIPLSIAGKRWPDAPAIRAPRDIAIPLMARFGRQERESLIVVNLDTKLHVIGEPVEVYRGNVSSSVVRISELFCHAIRLNASAILVAHNHPSQVLEASAQDLHLTAETIAAGRLLDIDVLDHLILGADSFISLRDRGVAFDRSVR